MVPVMSRTRPTKDAKSTPQFWDRQPVPSIGVAILPLPSRHRAGRHAGYRVRIARDAGMHMVLGEAYAPFRRDYFVRDGRVGA